MKTILEMLLLGFIAGAISVFWYRITSPEMLLSFVGKWLVTLTRQRTLKTGNGKLHPIEKFLTCMFCLTPWFVFLLSTIYIVAFHPVWYLAAIGVFGAIGAGNFVCEIVYAIRQS